MTELGRLIGGVGTLYFVFDFFVWNGGLVNPNILQRIANVGTILF
jgi:hypothetical protein